MAAALIVDEGIPTTPKSGRVCVFSRMADQEKICFNLAVPQTQNSLQRVVIRPSMPKRAVQK